MKPNVSAGLVGKIKYLWIGRDLMLLSCCIVVPGPISVVKKQP